MQRIFTISLLFISVHSATAMDKARKLVSNKPLTSVVLTSVTASLFTYGKCSNITLKNPYYEYNIQQIHRELAENVRPSHR